MENSKNYHDEQNNINTLKMREVVATLPRFCTQFFRGIQEYTSSRTRLAYAYDLRVFFEFIHNNRQESGQIFYLNIGFYKFNVLSKLYVWISFSWQI